MAFTVQRGVNISHWLSQSQQRGAAHAAWYADMMATFAEYDIAWANWDYKGSFGIVTADGQDTGLAEVLLSWNDKKPGFLSVVRAPRVDDDVRSYMQWRR